DLIVTGVQTCALPICQDAPPLVSERLRCGKNRPPAVARRNPGGDQSGQVFKRDACDVEGGARCVPEAPGEISDLQMILEASGARSEERRVGKECSCGW